MKNLIKNATQQFQQKNFASSIEIASTIKKSSKDYPIAKKLIADCQYSIGVTQIHFSDLIAAQKSFEKCLQLSPTHEDANNNLAGIFVKKGEIEKAIPHYEKCLQINPKRHLSMRDLAICYERIDNLEDASKLYQKLSESMPTDGIDSLRQALLVNSIIPNFETIKTTRENTTNKLDFYMKSARKISNPEIKNGVYFYFSYHGECNKILNLKIAQAYLHGTPELAWTSPHIPDWSKPSDKIKIGIISENLREHSIGHTSSGIIEKLDRNRFEVIVVHIGTPIKDTLHNWINSKADKVIYTDGNSLQSAREAISSIKLDIAFWQDIGMNPFSYFLAFSRLAPVQVTTFGHPDTTGIPNMDYFISSEFYETQNSDENYSEKLIRLPDAGTLSYYYYPEPAADLGRDHFGLSSSDNIYICPQTLFKIHPVMDAIFSKIFEKDHRARFILIEPRETNMKPALLKRILKKYPHLESRLTFIPRIANPATYKALLKCSDVMLDTVYFNGQNTNLEAFSVGLPIVTLPSPLQRGKHTLGMYMAMNFLELVANSIDDYADLAIKLINESDFSIHCRTEIKNRRSILYENMNFIHNLEKALIDMLNKQVAAI